MRFLSEYLIEEWSICPVLTREPGGCNISEKIRDLVLDIENREMSDRTEALLYAAARAQHVEEVIAPAVRDGQIVLCDRFIDSSLAYQGVGRGLGIEAVMDINRFAMGDMMPDKTFFLDFPLVDACCRLLSPLEEALHGYVLTDGKLHADDTPVPVLLPGNKKTKTGRLWTYVRDDRNAGSTLAPAVWFAYSPDRKGIHPQTHLAGFSGVLQADAVTNGAIVLHTQRLKSDPGGNLLS